jgi:hypothetical protein
LIDSSSIPDKPDRLLQLNQSQKDVKTAAKQLRKSFEEPPLTTRELVGAIEDLIPLPAVGLTTPPSADVDNVLYVG